MATNTPLLILENSLTRMENKKRMKWMRCLYICCACFVTHTQSLVQAQLFYHADLSTSPTFTQRFFMDSSAINPAPVGTSFWLVADKSGSGLTSSLYGEGGPDGYPPAGMETISVAQLSAIVAGTGNDQRFYAGQIDGTLLGDQPGKVNQPGIQVSSDFENARIFLFLWNDVNGNNMIGDMGDTFGLYDFGVSPPPAGGLGNASYLVEGNVYADRIAFTAVPEPEDCVLVVSISLLGWSIWRRKELRTKPQS